MFLQVCEFFFALAFLTLSFLFWPSVLLVCLVFGFVLLLLDVVSYNKFLCSCYCFCCFLVSLILLCVIFWICFLFSVFVFFGGFKGQVRWPKGTLHFALNPPYLFFCFCFVLLVFSCSVFFVFCVLILLQGLRVR